MHFVLFSMSSVHLYILLLTFSMNGMQIYILRTNKETMQLNAIYNHKYIELCVRCLSGALRLLGVDLQSVYGSLEVAQKGR